MSEPLVLLPGMMCDARLFRPQIEVLSGDRVVHIAPLIGADTVSALAENILRDAPQRFALAGLSMGGIVAMEMIQLAPDRISRLALLDTNYLPDSERMAHIRDRQIENVGKGGLLEVMRDEMKPKYLANTMRRKAILDRCMDMALGLGNDVFISQSKALRSRPDRTETLRNVSVPTLILCGEEDTLCPIQRHQEMHELITGSVLQIIEGAGHLPTLEQPSATNAALANWLNG
jgi:pimeloyl-ACP methyl ester carboxylesterase